MWLDRLVRLLLPRQGHFFGLLERIAEKMAAASAVFGELAAARGQGKFEDIWGRLKPIETDADEICHQIYEELDRTFVTPIDREDLAALTKTLDDIIDSMERAAAFAMLFRFEALTGPMRDLVALQQAAAAEVVRAVADLRNFRGSESIRGPTHAVHALENQADAIHRRAIEALFSGNEGPCELVRQKDMLFCLEEGTDRCEDAMDEIRSVVVKNG
jgi:predicted phosphate transport protein (TIGR00153 family)